MLSDAQWAEHAACSDALWRCAETLEALIGHKIGPGRPRECNVFEVLMLSVLAWQYRSVTRAAVNLADMMLWLRLRRAVESEYPDNPSRRLSTRPVSRSQHYRFRRRWLDADLLERLGAVIEDEAVATARTLGLFDPSAGSLTRPDPTCVACGDGTWLPALSGLSRRDAVDQATGEAVRRFDRDALGYYRDPLDRAPGYELIIVTARGDHPCERVILATRLRSKTNPMQGRSDGSIAAETLLDLSRRHPELGAGLRCFAYDMALSATDQNRLLDEGIIPVSKVRAARAGRVHVKNLGKRTFTTRDGTQRRLAVTAVDGRVCITATDSDGEQWYLPLTLAQVKHERRAGRILVATHRRVPEHPLAPTGLAAATVRIPLNARDDASAAGLSRSLRVFAESDPQFRALFGRREDAESINGGLKARLWNKRSPALGHNNVAFSVLAYQLHQLITAATAHQQRTTRPPPTQKLAA